MKILLCGIAAFWPAATFAKDLAEAHQPFALPNGVQVSFGFGAVGVSGVYAGQDDELFPLPLIALTYDRYTISLADGLGAQLWALSAQLWETDRTNVSAALAYNGAPDLPDTALFDGLNRDNWVGARLSATHDFGLFDVALSGQVDVSDEHGGGDAELSIGKTVSLGSTSLEGRIGAIYLDEKQSAYLYGVAENEATATRAAYAGADSWTPYVDLSATYPLSAGSAVTGFFRHEGLPDEIADSPLVAAEERTTIGVALVHSF